MVCQGLLLVYRDTNNIHAFIPVLTKPHQFLGTFSDERAEEEEEEEEEEEDGGDTGGRHGAPSSTPPSSTRRRHERTRSEEEPARQPLQAGQPLQQGGGADQAQGLVGGDQAQGALSDEHAHVQGGDARVRKLASIAHVASQGLSCLVVGMLALDTRHVGIQARTVDTRHRLLLHLMGIQDIACCSI